MANVRNVNDWARAQLSDLGIEPSRGAMQILVGWARAEGGNWHNDAHHNPLNTTQPMAGAGNTGSQGNIKQYRDWSQGIKATTRTLRNGRYGQILQALKAGNVDAGIHAISSSPWGTGGGLVAQTIRGTSSRLPTAPLSVTGSRGDSAAQVAADGGGGGMAAPTTRTTSTQRLVAPPVSNAAARAALAFNFLSPNRSQGPGSTLDFASQIQGLADVPAQYATDTRTRTIASATQSAHSAAQGTTSVPGGKSQLLELIHKAPRGPGYAVKDGKVVSGPGVYGAVWDGHADHVHVAAGPETIVKLGKLAQKMGLRVGENPHFGGVSAVHVPGSYHYKGEAIDVSGDPTAMDRYAARVERLYGLHH